MTVYVAEEFTPDEADVLRRYFTNLDGPVFALVNLPEVVKGALFARYSRSSKSLRRLFLDEFVGELDITGDATIDATVGLRRAEELYDRVFFEYGDDSVAQLGGVHLACEQASNLLTKVLEWGRLMAYLEQSTRYIAYDARLGGRYRYYRDPDVLQSPLGTRYVGDMDRLFDTYAELLPPHAGLLPRAVPRRSAGDSDFVYRQAIRAKAFDALRGILPAASLSNVGIYGTGQGYEQLLLRMRAHPLPEARAYADLMLTELRKVIPSFLKRVDLDDRGVAWSDYLGTQPRRHGRRRRRGCFPADDAEPIRRRSVRLVDFDPDAEVKLVAAMLYPHLAPARGPDRATGPGHVGRRAPRGHPGLRRRPHQPPPQAGPGPRAHRLPLRRRWPTTARSATCSATACSPSSGRRSTPGHGYTRPEAVDAAGQAARRSTRPWSARRRSTTPWSSGSRRRPPTPWRWPTGCASCMQMNAREAMHLIELRTTPQGHPAYRVVGQEMHRLIAEEAGHRAVAEMMRFVDHSPEPALERLDAERRAEARRQGG